MGICIGKSYRFVLLKQKNCTIEKTKNTQIKIITNGLGKLSQHLLVLPSVQCA